MHDKPKIVKISERDNRAITWSVSDLLESAKKVIEEEPKWGNKAMLIFLDDKITTIQEQCVQG